MVKGNMWENLTIIVIVLDFLSNSGTVLGSLPLHFPIPFITLPSIW